MVVVVLAVVVKLVLVVVGPVAGVVDIMFVKVL